MKAGQQRQPMQIYPAPSAQVIFRQFLTVQFPDAYTAERMEANMKNRRVK